MYYLDRIHHLNGYGIARTSAGNLSHFTSKFYYRWHLADKACSTLRNLCLINLATYGDKRQENHQLLKIVSKG